MSDILEPSANSLATEAFHEIDGLMVLVSEHTQFDFLTGTQLYFLLQPIRDHLEEITRLTSGPSPIAMADPPNDEPPPEAGAAALSPPAGADVVVRMSGRG